MPGQQARNNLYWQCRVGDPEALVTFLYQISDELYSAALTVAEGEPQAADFVQQAWGRLLQALKKWRFGGYMRPRTFAIMRRVLANATGPQAAQKAINSAKLSTPNGSWAVSAAPAELVETLVAQTQQIAPSIAAAAQARRRRSRILLAGAGLLVAALIGVSSGLCGRMVIARSPQVQFQCLQRRVIEDRLLSALHDAYSELPDPEGADWGRAHAYHRIGLVLEEIANAASLDDLYRLHYIKQRIDSEDLTVAARVAAWDSSGYYRSRLMHIALVLEEVQNL